MDKYKELKALDKRFKELKDEVEELKELKDKVSQDDSIPTEIAIVAKAVDNSECCSASPSLVSLSFAHPLPFRFVPRDNQEPLQRHPEPSLRKHDVEGEASRAAYPERGGVGDSEKNGGGSSGRFGSRARRRGSQGIQAERESKSALRVLRPRLPLTQSYLRGCAGD